MLRQENSSDAATAQRSTRDRFPFQSQMEALFGENFGDLDVVTGRQRDTEAAGGLAFQEGEQVVFGAPSPTPDIVAHELAHVVQRRHFGESNQEVSHVDDKAEQEARTAGQSAARGERPRVEHKASGRRMRATSRRPLRGVVNGHENEGIVQRNDLAFGVDPTLDTEQQAANRATWWAGVTSWLGTIVAEGSTWVRLQLGFDQPAELRQRVFETIFEAKRLGLSVYLTVAITSGREVDRHGTRSDRSDDTVTKTGRGNLDADPANWGTLIQDYVSALREITAAVGDSVDRLSILNEPDFQEYLDINDSNLETAHVRSKRTRKERNRQRVTQTAQFYQRLLDAIQKDTTTDPNGKTLSQALQGKLSIGDLTMHDEGPSFLRRTLQAARANGQELRVESVAVHPYQVSRDPSKGEKILNTYVAILEKYHDDVTINGQPLLATPTGGTVPLVFTEYGRRPNRIQDTPSDEKGYKPRDVRAWERMLRDFANANNIPLFFGYGDRHSEDTPSPDADAYDDPTLALNAGGQVVHPEY